MEGRERKPRRRASRAEGAGAAEGRIRRAIRPKLVEQFGYKNRFQFPTIDKVVINMGIGEGVADRKKVTPPPTISR